MTERAALRAEWRAQSLVQPQDDGAVTGNVDGLPRHRVAPICATALAATAAPAADGALQRLRWRTFATTPTHGELLHSGASAELTWSRGATDEKTTLPLGADTFAAATLGIGMETMLVRQLALAVGASKDVSGYEHGMLTNEAPPAKWRVQREVDAEVKTEAGVAVPASRSRRCVASTNRQDAEAFASSRIPQAIIQAHEPVPGRRSRSDSTPSPRSPTGTSLATGTSRSVIRISSPVFTRRKYRLSWAFKLAMAVVYM